MKAVTWLSILGLLIAVPSALPAQEGADAYNHGSAGIFVDYFRFSPASTTTNFVGLGGRAGAHLNRFTQLEGEINYDFARNFTNTFSNGITTQFVTSRVRPLTGLFGPKFQTPGRFKFFVTAKVGFINFTTTTAAVTPGALGMAFRSVGGSGTHFAVYPGGGIEGYWGVFGLRAEVGDAIYLNNGTFHNLRMTFGPQFRF